MRTDILDYLAQELRTRCGKPSNHFGMECYSHIEAVVKNGALLAERYGADKEVVMIASWLHDIASVTDHSLYEEHHLHGAEMARDLLTALGYDSEKISLVQACIRSHRGSVQAEKRTLEELCVADADAISHFDDLPSLLYLAYGIQGLGFEKGKAFVRSKLERSFQKLSPASKEYYREKCRQVLALLA